MLQTLNNILNTRISKEDRNCRLRKTETGWSMERWDDDTNHDTLTYPASQLPHTIFVDMARFLRAPFEECNVELAPPDPPKFVLQFAGDSRECTLDGAEYVHVLNSNFRIHQNDSRILSVAEVK